MPQPLALSRRLALLLCLCACAAPEMAPGAPRTLPAAELADLCALGSDDAADRADALARLRALPLADQCARLRAGLWLKDPAAATACARLIVPAWLDAQETARAADLLLVDAADPERSAAVLAVLGSREVSAVLARRPAPGLLARLGPLLRREHLPALLQWTADADAPCAAAAMTLLVQEVLPVCDHDQPAVAAALLRAPVAGTATTGLPPGLRQLIASWARDDADPLLRAPEVVAFWLRWLRGSTPGPDDVACLCQAVLHGLRGTEPQVLPLLVRALGQLDDPASAALLQRLATATGGPDPGLPAFVQAAQARRGDRSAAFALERQAGRDGLALLLLFDAAPERAERVLLERLLAPDPATVLAALTAWEQLLAAERTWGLHAPVGWQEPLAARLSTAGLPGLLLAALGTTCTTLRSEAHAGRCVQALVRRPPDAAALAALGAARCDALAAFLDLGAGDAFRSLLRDWAAAPTAGGVRTWARATLIHLHDRTSAAALAGWLDADLAALLPDARAQAAGIAAPEITALLRPAADDDGPGLVLFAAHGGLPWRLAEAILDPSPVRDDVVAALRAGQPRAGLRRFLAFSPDALLDGIGSVRDAEVRRWLLRFVQQRELGRVRWARHELLRQDDPAARADAWRGRRDGRPAWLQLEPTTAPDAEFLALVRADSSGNRTRATTLLRTVGPLLGVAPPGSPLRSPAACWPEPCAWVWSPLLQHLIPALARPR